MSPKGCIDGFADAVDDLGEDDASSDAIRGAERLRAGRLRAGVDQCSGEVVNANETLK